MTSKIDDLREAVYRALLDGAPVNPTDFATAHGGTTADMARVLKEIQDDVEKKRSTVDGHWRITYVLKNQASIESRLSKLLYGTTCNVFEQLMLSWGVPSKAPVLELPTHVHTCADHEPPWRAARPLEQFKESGEYQCSALSTIALNISHVPSVSHGRMVHQESVNA